MSSEISTSLLPFVSHQAVAVLLIIENSCAMACDWPNVRDRYVRTMVESLKAANTTVPMELKVLPTLPSNTDHVSSPTELCEYNDLKDLQFNHSPDNRLSPHHVHRGIEHLVSSDVGKLPSTVRHIFIVAATPPSDTFAHKVDTEHKPEWQALAEKLTETHIYYHLIANSGQNMSHLHNLFEETLHLQGNVENKAHVRPWNAVNTQMYAVRLASRTQVQICATTAVRGKPYTAGRKGKEPAGRLTSSRQGSPKGEMSNLSATGGAESPTNEPSLVAHLQKIHGLVKKKVHSVPPPRPPFFRDDPVDANNTSSASSLEPSAEITQLEPKSDGGRVQSQFKVDRSSRLRSKTSRSRSHSTATPTSPSSRKWNDLSCITELLEDKPNTRSRSNSKLQSAATRISSPLSPSVTDAMDSFSLRSHTFPSQRHNIETNVLDSLPPLYKEQRTVFLPVPAYPSLTTVVNSLQAQESSPSHNWVSDSSAGRDSHRSSRGNTHAVPRSLIPEAHLSELTNDEEFMRQTRSIIAKMTPDQVSGSDDAPRRSLRSSEPELLQSPQSGMRVARSSRSPTPAGVELTEEVQTNWNAADSAPTLSPVPVVVKTPSADDLFRQSSLQAGYWHDMALLFGPNNPNPGIEGLPRYPVPDGDNGHVVDLDVSGNMLYPSNHASVMPVGVQDPENTSLFGIPSLANGDVYALGTAEFPPSYATSVDSFSQDPTHDPSMFDMNNESMLSLLGYLNPPAPSYEFLTNFTAEASLGFNDISNRPEHLNPAGESPRWRFGS